MCDLCCPVYRAIIDADDLDVIAGKTLDCLIEITQDAAERFSPPRRRHFGTRFVTKGRTRRWARRGVGRRTLHAAAILPLESSEILASRGTGISLRTAEMTRLDPATLDTIRPAIAVCAADLGIDNHEVQIVEVRAQHKSTVLFASSITRDGPTHVIKLEESTWNPDQEYQGLKFAQSVFDSSETAAANTYKAIRPVGFGCAPSFLVTRFQEGKSLLPEFLSMLSLFGSPRLGLPLVLRYAERIAEWLGTFRSHSQVHTSHTPDRVLEFCRQRLEEIPRGLLPFQKQSILRIVEKYLGRLAPGEVREIGRIYPSHGDPTPQNFLVDSRQNMYSLDFESFRFVPMNYDLGVFRRRLENYGLAYPLARKRLLLIWQSFVGVVGQRESDTFMLLCYIHFILEDIAWKSRRDMNNWAGASFWQKLRGRLWISQRLAWLSSLEGNVVRDWSQLRNAL